MSDSMSVMPWAPKCARAWSLDRLFDPPSGGQLVGEVPGRLFEGGQLARHLAGGQRSHDQIGQAGPSGRPLSGVELIGRLPDGPDSQDYDLRTGGSAKSSPLRRPESPGSCHR